jgi:hypothetical protein
LHDTATEKRVLTCVVMATLLTVQIAFGFVVRYMFGFVVSYRNYATIARANNRK